MTNELLISVDDIQKAAQRLKGVAVITPLLNNAYLDSRLQAQVFIKPENLQHIGAFKFRGAYNRLAQCSAEERQKGVIAYSSGNHAQGIAYAARLLHMPATIVMPSDAPKIKIEGTRQLGAEIRFYDRVSESREEITAAIAQNTGAVIVPAFDDLDVIAGQGTCGMEMAAQIQLTGKEPDSIFIPCGGGGLLAGCSVALKSSFPQSAVYGVEPDAYDDHKQSMQAGTRTSLKGPPATLCDALMAPMPGKFTWAINSRTVTDFISVSDDEVAHAISFAFRYLKLVVEPGGAVALAALLSGRCEVKGKIVGVLLSGGNVDAELFNRCLERYPAP